MSFLLLQLSNSFLRILAAPNKAVFCNSPVLIVTPSFSSHASNLLLTTPSAPTTTGTTSRCLVSHSLPISLLRSWYFSSFHLPFHTLCGPRVKLCPLWLPCYFPSQQHMVISHKILQFSFSTTPSGWCLYHFSPLLKSYLQKSFKWTNLAILSCLLLYSFCANILHSLRMWFIVSPFWLHILQSGESTDLSMLNLT